MLTTKTIKVTGVLASSSKEFVQAVLSLYASKSVVLVLRNREITAKLSGLAFDEIRDTSHSTGWIRFGRQTFSTSPEPAQVTYTSGTEGIPKGMVLSHRALSDVVERLNRCMEVDETIREYIGVPVYYSFGLGRVRCCAAVGGACYIPESGFNPIEIAKLLGAGEINAISAVPTLWRTLLAEPDLVRKSAHRVRWIEIGSQYMAQSEKEALRSLFPNARIIQHYGLTEASRSTFLDISRTEGEALESVGRPVGRVEVDISAEGRIRVRGPHVALGRVTAAGIESVTDADGWLTTADRGRLDNGYLYYLGRADDIINCGGVKLSPDVLEQRMLDALQIKGGLAVSRYADPMRGDGVAVAVTSDLPVDTSSVEQVARDTIAASGARIGGALKVVRVDALPRTETGKVKRRSLAALVEAQQKEMGPPAETPPIETVDHAIEEPLREKLISVWRAALGETNVSTNASFYENGGDSLSGIRIMLLLERAGVDQHIARRVLAGETIDQIAGNPRGEGGEEVATSQTGSRTVVNAINMTRGILVLALIAIHYSPGLIGRLPVDSGVAQHYLNPFYRFGTPGFAIVFGMGVSFFYFPQIAQNAAAAHGRLRFALLLIASASIVWAIARAAVGYLSPPDEPVQLIVRAFFSVLPYYMLAVLTVPLWYRVVARAGSTVLNALFAALCCTILHRVVGLAVGHERVAPGLLELLRLIIEAKYGYFLMTSYVMCGIAVGASLTSVETTSGVARRYALIGVSLAVLSIILSMDPEGSSRWMEIGDVVSSPFAVIGYLGLIILMLSASLVLQSREVVAPLRRSMNVLKAMGILSLPMFIGHEMVWPVRDLLSLMGMPRTVTLFISLGAFAGCAVYLVRRVMRLV